jgi:hypothetical protein
MSSLVIAMTAAGLFDRHSVKARLRNAVWRQQDIVQDT